VALKIRDVKETALYCENLERSGRFYRDVLGLEVLVEDPRLIAFDVAGRHVLLLFQRGASQEDLSLPGGVIPGHDGAGPTHIGFAVAKEELAAWEARLLEAGVTILSHVDWPLGGRSVYFRDPEGHMLELLTPGVWKTY
jgi:catechol 2,3-dioxygenase-like lactoylglutathione lyase family enzyme